MTIADQLRAAGVDFGYETLKLNYIIPESRHVYTPDFPTAHGMIIETKGLFQTDDRKKMTLVKAQHPELDIRLLFSNANAKIAKGSKTTYAKWAEDHGFPWAHRRVPQEWLAELLA